MTSSDVQTVDVNESLKVDLFAAQRNTNATLAGGISGGVEFSRLQERRESAKLATKQPENILGYKVYDVAGRVFGGKNIVSIFIHSPLFRRLGRITKASRRFNSEWATRNSKETG